MSISLSNLDASKATAVSAMNVAAAVRAAREAVGYSVDDLAVTCGLVVNEIEEIEGGEDADPAKLKRIAAALQVPLSSLVPM
ncbi:transcriptional regulator with XRE-family HTH domain [Rhizobium tibeticum]|uniref:Helix-turn-helix domain protein n=2 Tax=Rhizobium TaxID=379 RepID=A0A1H8CPT6_9HYPH|nr:MULTISPECIES: helix-turn-helix domain-containing protein [Rhizobium]MCA0800694.1 helix-turn-helix domain-containing protein [Rhizobium sp. T1473]MCS0457410.1 helix-turn-helix domain-containing protein [Rhizobium favelukesii]MDP9808242.1 transcriptional regulator with XRE-family HTH domain [Rhizobium tibeticum]UFS81801.1 helix-turn-helix domain-containing protein [Rhizobium sp. T136]CDM56543.1 XRE family transcriptional regulator [Rhizobium favelukesii]